MSNPDQQRLERENRELSQQIKLLVQTEQRLYRSQVGLDRQLTRIEALGDFALESAWREEPEVILGHAADLLMRSFDLDLVLAGMIDEGGRAIDLLVIDGSDVPTQLRVAFPESLRRELRRRTDATLFDPDPEVGAAYSALTEIVGREHPRAHVPQPGLPLFCVPLRYVGGNPTGFILGYRHTERQGSNFVEAPAASNLPFLRLLGNLVDRAMQNADLKLKLRERSDQLQASLDHLEHAQQELVQARKMEAVGSLAGGVAHDFNNILTIILGQAELLKTDAADDARIQGGLKDIVEAGERAARITSQLLAFSRKQRQKPEVVDILELAGGMVQMLQSLVSEHIELQLVTHDGASHIWADRSHLEQVLLNLVVNARDAMPAGGRITVQTRVIGPERVPESVPHLTDREWIEIAVTDTGRGMDSETRSRVFEPFFTTKGIGHGTGLGLATAYGLVQQNRGVIQVKSEVGRGSSFTVLFPLTKRATQPLAARAHQEEAPAQVATILLAEDETGIRDLGRQLLEGEGYRVVTAVDGHDALALVEAQAVEVDLLICDVVMPNMGGIELTKTLRRQNPGLQVLFISGYGFETLNTADLDEEAQLQKPFRPEEFRRLVRDVLERGAQRGSSNARPSSGPSAAG